MGTKTERTKLPLKIEGVLKKLEKNELWNIDYSYKEFSKLVKILDEIEKFPFSLNEFERVKRCAYEIISAKKVIYIKVYEGQYKSIELNKGINDALRSKVEALVNSSYESDSDERMRCLYSGLPVKKAKGKWLRNFLLKHFY